MSIPTKLTVIYHVVFEKFYNLQCVQNFCVSLYIYVAWDTKKFRINERFLFILEVNEISFYSNFVLIDSIESIVLIMLTCSSERIFNPSRYTGLK